MVDVVVLLGAPGSGKSAVGTRLARGGMRWRDWETELLQRWGSRDEFIAHKSDALPAFHDEVLRWIASECPTAVFETTGLSDAPLLSLLEVSREAFVVRLEVSEEEALRRIEERTRGRHLSDDLDVNRRVWRAFHEHVIERVHADLVIDTNARPADSIAAEIVAALPDDVRPDP